jgi:acyl-CoA synthetase (AMP-forming)/AMP-acid ligase II
MHLAGIVAQLARRHRDRTAIVDGTGVWSYRQLVGRINRFGHALIGLGLQKGDRVALLVPDIREYLEADYGIMSGGFVRVPLDPRLTAQELAAQLRHAGVRALVTHSLFGERVDRLPSEVESLEAVISIGDALPHALDYEALLAAASDRPLSGGDGGDLATLNFSGGTTSAPKAVMLSHGNLLVAAQNAVGGFAIGPNQIFLNVRPLWPIAQIVLMSHIMAGATVVLGGRFDPERLASSIQHSGADRTSLVPTQLMRFVEYMEGANDPLRRLKVVQVGGSSIPPSVFERALATLGPRIAVHYGLTEAPVTCCLPPDRLDTDAARQRRLIHSVGRELVGYEVRIADDQPGSGIHDGQTGEVLIRGDHVMAGYWRDTDATQAALCGGWLHTGDIGQIDEEGDLYIVGRLKDVIRSGSSTIIPKEIEDVIARHPAVAEVAVLGLPDVEWGELATAFVVVKPGASVAEGELVEHCRTHLASFKKPRSIRFVSSLPRSHYGKVLRTQLLKDAIG